MRYSIKMGKSTTELFKCTEDKTKSNINDNITHRSKK